MQRLISWTLRNIPRKYLQHVSHYLLRFSSLFMRGNQVECPICEISYNKFLPYGRLKPRPNALCPDSLSLERHRLMWLYLKEKTNFFTEPHRLLHIAPELCFIKTFKSLPNIDYTTADLESPLADVKMDVHDIPFDDQSFDVVFCNHVMEHVNNDILAMKEIYRVLRPGGWAIIQSPQDYTRENTLEDPSITSPKERERVYWQKDHVRLYGMDYGKRLASAGFRVKEDPFVMEMSEEKVKRYALPPNEIIYFCAKG